MQSKTLIAGRTSMGRHVLNCERQSVITSNGGGNAASSLLTAFSPEYNVYNRCSMIPEFVGQNGKRDRVDGR